MNKIKSWAEDRPLFTLNDVERISGLDREYLRVKLHRMVEKKELKRVERGKYTVHEDPLIYATHIETPSFFSYWTALRYYNLTTQEPSRLQVMTRKNRKNLAKIEFHSSTRIFGYRKHQYKGFEIFVADKERLLLDCLSRKIVPVDELTELLEEVDGEKMIGYTKKFENKALSKRVGYLLEEFGENMEQLQEFIDHNYTVLDLSKPEEGEKNPRWKVLVNADVS